MPRPVSWLPRLHEITRTVSTSARSHYDRRDLEKLFELQPRAAQKMLEMLPTVQVGTSRLVDREVLAGFLEGVRDADNTEAYLERTRLAKAATSHRKIRSLVRRDTEPISIDSLPSNIVLTQGRMEVTFATIEELAEAMYALARVLETDGEQIALAYELHNPRVTTDVK